MILVPRVDRFVRTKPARWVVLAVAVGFLLRLAWGLWSMRSVPDNYIAQGDQYSYWYYGDSIAHGRGVLFYLNTTRPTAYYPIGYPALLGVTYWLGLHTPLPDNEATMTMLLQLTLSTVSIVLVYFIGRKVFNHRVGLVAAWITALFPGLIAGVGTFSVETTFIFAALLCLSILVDHDWTQPMTRRRLLWFGVTLGCCVLIRPFLAPAILGLAVAVWLSSRSMRSVLRHLGWMAITFVLVLTPWTIRNEVRFDRFIPISNNLGDTLCMARYVGSDGGFAWAYDNKDYCADSTLPEAEKNTANTKAAIRFVRDHPTEELRLIPKRFLLMMGNDHTSFDEALSNGSNLTVPSGVRSLLNFSADWYFRLACLLSVIGIGLLYSGWRRDPVRGPRKALVAIPVAFLVIIPVFLWGNPRFHAPLLPFLALCDAATIDWLLSRRRDRGSTPSAPTSDSDSALAGTTVEGELVAVSDP